MTGKGIRKEWGFLLAGMVLFFVFMNVFLEVKETWDRSAGECLILTPQ